MMAIADLYAKEGATDPGQVKSWQAKAQSCQGGNTAMLQQQVARFKARAAAARDPALNTVLAALPNITNPPTQAAGINSRLPAQGRSTDASGFNRSILVGLVAAAAVVTAAAMMAPNTPGNAASDSNYDAQAAMADMSRCYRVSSSGLNPNLYGC
jgi:hypothetical protein